MPMLRTARAAVTAVRLYDGGWDNVRVASGQSRSGRSLVDQASKILKAEFDPSKYLLTHCTIVASVDTYKVPGVKIGSATVDGKKVLRKTDEFRIKPDCDVYINNNLDSWSRPVLLKSYKTFVGGHNFQEHVQIEELSKGRLLDAVARDIGTSVYVDILIATDRKHTELIKDIESGEMSTLSMGCSIDGSTCTKCGHWAADETEMCEHIRYAKGNVFYDEKGQRHRIAELCGDVSLDPTGGVTFIEASWVKVPAFKGAVARNIVTLTNGDNDKTARVLNVNTAFESVSKADPEAVLKAASLSFVAGEDYVPDDMPSEDTSDQGSEPPPSEPKKSPFEDVENELTTELINKVKKRVKDQLTNENGGTPVPYPGDNNNLSREAKQALRRAHDLLKKTQREVRVAKVATYRAAIREVMASSIEEVELVNRIATLNKELGISVPQIVYRVALKVGPTQKYSGLDAFLGACRDVMGTQPTVTETKTLIRLGNLLSTFAKRLPG